MRTPRLALAALAPALALGAYSGRRLTDDGFLDLLDRLARMDG